MYSLYGCKHLMWHAFDQNFNTLQEKIYVSHMASWKWKGNAWLNTAVFRSLSLVKLIQNSSSAEKIKEKIVETAAILDRLCTTKMKINTFYQTIRMYEYWGLLKCPFSFSLNRVWLVSEHAYCSQSFWIYGDGVYFVTTLLSLAGFRQIQNKK